MNGKMPKRAVIMALALLLCTGFSSVRAGEVFVASTDLLILDDGAYAVTANVPLGKWVYNITVSDDGKYAYVGASNGLNIFDVGKKKFEGLLTDKPAFVVKTDQADNRIFVLTNDRVEHPDGTVEAQPSKVMVFDSRDKGLLRTLDLDRIVFDIEIIQERDRLYCLDILESKLLVYQLTSGSLIETIELGNYGFVDKNRNQGFLWRMIRDKGGEKIYIPQGGIDAGVLIVDTGSNSTRRLPLDHEAKWRGGVISPDGKLLYLNAVRRLAVIDLAKEAEIAWRPLDGPYQGLAIDENGKKLYLTNPMYDTGGSVAVLDATTLVPLGRIVVPDASPFAVAVAR